MEPGGGRIDSRPLTAEEEAAKRNTDCVYFLASPLTCKKGNDCEYRHSEGARVNPRDCWYWLNGNCMNPKCSFRHPPLDGLFGAPGTAASGPTQHPSQTVASTQIPVVHAPVSNLNKQSVPCIYFQKGHCLKGDRCPFMHGPQPTGKPVPHQVAKISTTATNESQKLKDSWSMKECTSQKNILTQHNIPKMTVDKPIARLLSSVKPVRTENATSNCSLHEKYLLSYPSGDKLPRSQPTHAPVNHVNSYSSGNKLPRLLPDAPLSHSKSLSSQPHYQMHLSDDGLQNSREPGELLGETSPGSDVLLASKSKDIVFIPEEEDSRRASVHSGRSLDPVNDYDQHHSDYEPAPRLERGQLYGVGNFERHGKAYNAYELEPRRISSERILDRPLLPERKLLQRHKSPDEMFVSDLRHRLLKQRRLNGSRSAVTPDHGGEPYRRDDHHMGDRYLGHYSHRDELQLPLQSSVSNRLHGRISLPRRSPPDVPLSLQSEKERDMAGQQGRISPARPVSYQGRHHDKIRQRPGEDPHSIADPKNFGAQPVGRNDVDSLNFAGPKSLAELKEAKVVKNPQEQSSKSISARLPLEQNSKVASSHESEGSLQFEGPKPLSVILKRKRGAEPENDANSSGGHEKNENNGALSSCGSENNWKDANTTDGNSVSAAVAGEQSICAMTSNKEIHTVSSYEESEVITDGVRGGERGLIPTEAEKLTYGDQSLPKGDMLFEDDMVVDTTENQEQQNSYQGDGGESDYEAIEAGDFKTEDENPYQEDEEDLDDEDDFARKVGIIFS